LVTPCIHSHPVPDPVVPGQAPQESAHTVRRVPVSADASALSLAHFLDLAFGGRHLAAAGRPLHTGFARYFGCGAAVACFVWEPIGPAQVRRSDASRAGTAAAVLLENLCAVHRFIRSCHVMADVPMVCSPAVWHIGQTKVDNQVIKKN